MKALICETYGNPASLTFQEVSLASPAGTQVLIEVKACGLNFPDLLMIQNQYQFKPELPFSPGGEVAGVVKAVGSEVSGIEVGDRVVSICRFGGLAEQVLAESDTVFKLPEPLDFISGASFFYNYATAMHALKDRAGLKAGEKLLVMGAAGGVGLAAVVLGKWLGARVIAAASSGEKLRLALDYGADEAINYTLENLRDQIKELTHGRGVDVVFDPVGGAFAEAAIRELAWQGRYLVVGFASGEVPQIPFNLPLLKGGSVTGVFYSRFVKEEPLTAKANLRLLEELNLQGKITGTNISVYSLDEAKEALEALQQRKIRGKAVVITGTLEEARYRQENREEQGFGKQPLKIDSREEVYAWIGRELGVSEWLCVTQETVQAFADATFDQQWIHTDVVRAAGSVFGGTIAHGYLTLSVIPKLLESVYKTGFSSMGINYGTEKIRFLSPVKAGSRIRVKALLKNASETNGGGLKMTLACTVEIENEDKPACYAEIISVLY